WLSVDQKQAHGVLAEGPTLNGTVKSVDAGKNVLTLTVGSRGGQGGEERTVTLSGEAGGYLDGSKGRRLSVKAAKLADVPVGAAAQVRLSADQSWATFVRVEGLLMPAILKSVDAGKGTLTFAIPAGRGENPEEKTLPATKDVRILIEG